MNLPEPYYDDGQCVIYHGDARDVLPHIDADVMVTDPPYGSAGEHVRGADGYGRRRGNQRGAGRVGQHIANDLDTTIRDQVLAMWRGPVALFASARLPEPPGEWADRLVWDKKRPGTNSGPWRYRHEMVYVSPGFVRANDAAVSVLVGYPADQALHIHAKPLAVVAALVEAAPPGVIVDPFMGSGTTLRAALDLGRRAIGVEIEERYCEVAVKRLAQGALDFVGAPQGALDFGGAV